MQGVCVLRNTLVTSCTCAKGYRVITLSVHSCVDLFVCLRHKNELSWEAYDVYLPRKSQKRENSSFCASHERDRPSKSIN